MATLHARAAVFLLLAAAVAAAHAHGGAPSLPVPAELAPRAAPQTRQPQQAQQQRPKQQQQQQQQPPAHADETVAELKFAEMFASPVGPLGLQPSSKLLALDGRQVRLVGYMASAEQPMAGRLVLTPLPVSLGDEDESLSDDLPPSAVFVHLGGGASQVRVPNLQGLLQLTGTLRVGALDEPDGHVSSVRLELDARETRRLVAATARASAAAKPQQQQQQQQPSQSQSQSQQSQQQPKPHR